MVNLIDQIFIVHSYAEKRTRTKSYPCCMVSDGPWWLSAIDYTPLQHNFLHFMYGLKRGFLTAMFNLQTICMTESSSLIFVFRRPYNCRILNCQFSAHIGWNGQYLFKIIVNVQLVQHVLYSGEDRLCIYQVVQHVLHSGEDRLCIYQVVQDVLHSGEDRLCIYQVVQDVLHSGEDRLCICWLPTKQVFRKKISVIKLCLLTMRAS
jgi:hypothetical protein